MYLYSFEKTEHRRAKQKEKAKKKRTCRPWLWAPNVYKEVERKIKQLKRRFVRKIPESEFDRQWFRRRGRYMTLSEFIACIIKLVGVFFSSLVFCLIVLFSIGFVIWLGAILGGLILTAAGKVHDILFKFLVEKNVQLAGQIFSNF
ncbi:hypothetical protein Btru_006084 [Bulinus truncatus]|nr:hypothetical protein Btru_006084 [Bulinus truncatus]